MRNIIKLSLALVLGVLAGCSTTPQSTTARSDYLLRPDSAATLTQRQRILSAAESMLGAPYRLGGNSASGIDCSGLVHYAYGQAGIEVPRTADDLYHAGLLLERVKPGDLLFFTTSKRRVSHVGIYAGNGQMIHASSRGGRVQRVSLNQSYWRKHLIGGATYLACANC